MPDPVSTTILANLATQFLRLIMADGYDSVKNLLKPNDKKRLIAKSWNDFRDSYLEQAEDNSIKFNIFKSFFTDDDVREQFAKIFSGEKHQIDFDRLEEIFIDKCRAHGHGRVPDFNFVQTIADVVENIETLAQQKPEFRAQFTQQKLSDIRALLDKRGVEHNPSLAKRIYLKQLQAQHGYLKFTGIPDYRDKNDIAVSKVFVMPRAEEDIPPRDYRQHLSLLNEDEDSLPDELTLRRELRVSDTARKGAPRKVNAILDEESDHRFVILGAPGSGKSTLLEYLALDCAEAFQKERWGEAPPRFPLLVKIRDFEQKLRQSSDPGYSIREFLYDFIRSDYCLALPDGFFEKYLNAGNALLLFDGLDEVAEEARRQEIKDKIHLFINNLPASNRVIITSRIAGYIRTRFNVEAYRHFTLTEFDDDEIAEFSRNWYRCREASEADADRLSADLTEALTQKPQVKELARNPLLLTIIGVIHRYEAQLPEDRLTLYKKATEALLHTWESAKRLDQKFNFERKHQFLEKVGFELQQQESGESSGTTIPREALLELLIPEFVNALKYDDVDARSEAREFIERIRTRSGLVVELAPGQYGFVHKTFQEYFAAAYIARETKDNFDLQIMKDYVKEYITNPFWQEVLLLALQDIPPKQTLVILKYIVNDLNSYGTQDLLRSDQYFVMKFLAEKGTWLEDRQFVEEQAAAFFEWSLENISKSNFWNAYPWARFQNWIANVSDSTCNMVINHILLVTAEDSKQDGVLRRNCVSAVLQLGLKDRAVIDRLLGIVEDSKQDSDLHRFCAFAVGQLGLKDHAVIDRLLSIAEDSKQDGDLHHYCASAIGKLGFGDRAVDILLNIAEDGKQDSDLRSDCASAVGELGLKDRAIIDRLLGISEDSKQDSDLRSDCAYTVGELGLKDYTVIDRLLGIAEDSKQDGNLRSDCAKAVGELGLKDRAVIDRLLNIAEDSKQDSFLRSDCASAMWQLGDKKLAIELLIKLYRETEDEDTYDDLWRLTEI